MTQKTEALLKLLEQEKLKIEQELKAQWVQSLAPAKPAI